MKMLTKEKWLRKLAIGGLLATMLLGAAGCSSSNSADAGSAGKKKIEYKPYCYLDEKNNLTGFEVEVLKKINERLPQYEFEFKNFDFNAILVSLETGKIDLAAHQFEINPDRKNKFLFGDVGITTYDLQLVVKEERTDIQSLNDLANLNGTVEVGKASANKTAVTDKWNKENGNRLKLILEASDPTITLQNLASGKTDAFVNIQRNVDAYKKTYGAKIKAVGEPISRSSAYYLYRKNDATGTQLKQDVDRALQSMKDDGTLLELSKKWLGGDYVSKI
jgi:L-cystine transport system substrate-binding protein